MRLVRFSYKRKEGWGIEENREIKILQGAPFSKIKLSGQKLSLKRIKLLAPAQATKIILVGLNYRDHAQELGMKAPVQPIIFLKPPTTLIGHREGIIYPPGVKRLDYEAELAVIIKRKAKRIHPEEAPRFILGYTCLNDITARDVQKRDIQWTRAKSFDTFCPLGPWVETKVDPSDLKIRSYVNGKVKQNSSTSNFIFSINKLISFISSIMTLLPGDVISTGTPPGVGPLKPLDTVEIEIEGVGRLKNYVKRS
jgi:2-keto-4-pentenoate hydratase/2-oxohepta-3-ene-1,7-dioic acid hydratase in catechol pathway